jgi:purine-binding chemotaxis protein CheW
MSETRQFCTFYVDGRLYGMPVEEVQEVIKEQFMTRIPLATEIVSGLINLRGKIVTAIDLRKRLGLAGRKSSGAPMNVVVNYDDHTVSFLVDFIGDVVDAEENSFEPVPETIHGEARELLLGVYKLKTGLLHVLDARKSADLGSFRAKVPLHATELHT